MKYRYLIIGFLLLAFITRVVRLDYSPPSLSNDEISIAYEAYSISKTLRDSHNKFLPVSFKSHGTYKAPLAIYLAIPTTIIFGNNEYSVRLPSAILGTLTIIILGLLVYQLTQNLLLSFLSSAILSITPWHIYTSRMALESNIALFFLVLGLYLFFYGLRNGNKIVSLLIFFIFALAIYAYHTEWGLIPLLMILLLFFYKKSIVKNKIHYLGLIVFILMISPIVNDSLNNLGTNARLNTQSIIRDPSLMNKGLSPIDKAQLLPKIFLYNYSQYTNLGYLFFKGLHLLPLDDPFQVGLFLSPFLPCFILGLVKIKTFFKHNSNFIYSWLIISPVIPALTIGETSEVRNLPSIIPYVITISVGCLVFYNYLREKVILSLIAFSVISISFFYFLVIYFYHFPNLSAENFQYGYKQMAQYIKGNYDRYNKIVIDPRFGDHFIYSGVPNLYVSYFTNIDPIKVLNSYSLPFYGGFFFDKYEIRNIDWGVEKVKENYLYAVPYHNSPNLCPIIRLNFIKEIELPNHKHEFLLYETGNK